MDPNTIDVAQLLFILFLFISSAAALLIISLVWVIWRVKRIDLLPDADFWVALRLTPFIVVVLLDLLDFFFDFLAAPVAWIILGRLGLLPLRGVTVIQQLIPGTQLLPVMTLAWIVARLFKKMNMAELNRMIGKE